jgi:hypothetical protein
MERSKQRGKQRGSATEHGRETPQGRLPPDTKKGVRKKDKPSGKK